MVLKGGTCVQPIAAQQTPCQPGQHRGADGVCFSCSHNDHFENGRCVPCQLGFHAQGDACVRDTQATTTQPAKCPPGQLGAPPNCKSALGMTGTPPNCCPPGSLFKNGQCVQAQATTTQPAKCPPGQLASLPAANAHWA
jgi:hypothetical protein